MWSSLRKLDTPHLLAMVGLERRRSRAARLVPGVALFGAGVLVGVGVGLMVAPRSGRELRGQLSGRQEPRLPQVVEAPELESLGAPS